MKRETDFREEQNEISNEESSTMETKRRSRTVMTPAQSRILLHYFDLNPFPSTELREELSKTLKMKARTVQIWFQNQRQKLKNRYDSECDYKMAQYRWHANIYNSSFKGLDILASAALGKIFERQQDELAQQKPEEMENSK